MSKKIILPLVLMSLVLVACKPDERPTKPGAKKTETSSSQVTIQNDKQTGPTDVVFDQHQYTYDVVSGATQTTFGTTPPALYSKEEKAEKMFWSNQPPLGILTGYYYKAENTFDGSNQGQLEVVTSPKDGRILNVEFTEFASEPYYEKKYSGVNKRLSDYAFFQASNTRTDETLVTVVNGITFVEQQMRQQNRLDGEFLTVKGSSTSARRGLMPLAQSLAKTIKEPSPQRYHGSAKELSNGLIPRLEVITEGGKIVAVTYDEYFADQESKMTAPELKEFYRQSKYYSIDYQAKFGTEFNQFADQLVTEILAQQTLAIDSAKLKNQPAFAVYQELAQGLKLDEERD